MALGSRRTTVVAGVAAGVLALLLTTTTWVTARTVSAVDAAVPLAVAGTDAAPAAAAGALVVVAASLALALGRRWGSRLAAVGVAFGGVLLTLSAAAVLADPSGPAVAAAQATVGVGVLDGPVRTTAAPWVAAILGGVSVALAARAAALGGRWSAPSGRHEPAAAPPDDGTDDDAAAWDALTRGEDPT